MGCLLESLALTYLPKIFQWSPTLLPGFVIFWKIPVRFSHFLRLLVQEVGNEAIQEANPRDTGTNPLTPIP